MVANSGRRLSSPAGGRESQKITLSQSLKLMTEAGDQHQTDVVNSALDDLKGNVEKLTPAELIFQKADLQKKVDALLRERKLEEVDL